MRVVRLHQIDMKGVSAATRTLQHSPLGTLHRTNNNYFSVSKHLYIRDRVNKANLFVVLGGACNHRTPEPNQKSRG